MAAAIKDPTAMAFGYGEAQVVAKVLTEFIRSTKSNMKIKGGFLPDRVLSAAEVETLARLPSREVLIAQVLAGLQSPLYRLVNVFSGPMRGLMTVLQARMKQLEGA